MTGSALHALLRQIHHALSASHTPFALVGGLAVSARAEPRFTRDVDVLVAVADDDDAEALIRSLRDHGLVPFALVEQVATGRLATARLRNDRNMICDLLFATTGIESRIVAAAMPMEVAPGVRLPVASTEHLLAMKVLSSEPGRPQDHMDLLALLATGPDMAAVRAALEAIQASGAHRQQDLLAKWERLLATG